MTIKKAYYYLFYKLYKFGEWSPSIFPSDFTAAFAICILELLFLWSLDFYATQYLGLSNNFKFVSFRVMIPLSTMVLINYFAFINNTNWKTYIREFDKWSPKKNMIGTWIVIGIIAFIIANFSFASIVLETPAR